MRLSQTLILTVGLCWFSALRSYGHDPGLSSAKLTLQAGRIEATIVFARADVESLFPLDANSDGKLSTEELSAAKSRLQGLATSALEIISDGERIPAVSPRATVDENNNVQLDVTFPGRAPKRLFVRSVLLADLALGHRQFVSVHSATNQLLEEHLLSAKFDSFEAILGEAGSKHPVSRAASFFDFFALGVKHILLGYDHLLFLFALLIVCDSFLAVAKIITCFTLAHSLTLALATFDIVQLPSRVVEPLIAASIVYVGLENIFRRDHLQWRWLLTFTFGLIHGFGFASILREMGAATSGRAAAIPLVAFNLGVEAGQMGLAAVFLPCIWRIRTRPVFVRRWVPAASACVAALGAFWLVERILHP